MKKSVAPTLKRDLVGHIGHVNAVRFTKDGNYCMTCSDDRTLKLWNPHKDELEKKGQALTIKTYAGVHGYAIHDVVISSDNNKFISAGGDKASILWDVSTGRVIRKFYGHTQRINCVSTNEEHTVLLSGSYDKTVRIYDLKSNLRDPIQILNDCTDSVTSIQRTNYEILVSSVDGFLRIYDLRAGMLSCDSFHEPITSLSLTHDQKCVLSATLGGTIRLTEISTGRLLQHYHGHRNDSYKIETCVTNDDARVIGTSEDGHVLMWDLVEASVLHNTVAHTRSISSISYHPSLSCYVTASFDNTAKYWIDLT
mmetsp:Transcript_23410/g.23610  ORF Transcript_23410/g.23610 Transcript_23410/m.23610 type:complete len:310 (+) Transcript_23410:172-1101(+)